MRFTITGRNIDVTDGLRSAVEEKIGKLERYFKPDTEVLVTLSVEKDRQKIEVTIPVKGNIIRSEQVRIGRRFMDGRNAEQQNRYQQSAAQQSCGKNAVMQFPEMFHDKSPGGKKAYPFPNSV